MNFPLKSEKLRIDLEVRRLDEQKLTLITQIYSVQSGVAMPVYSCSTELNEAFLSAILGTFVDSDVMIHEVLHSVVS